MENTIQKSFFSKNNIDSLKAWMTENFVTKKGYNIDSNDLQDTIVGYMENVYGNKETFIPSKMPPRQKLLNLNKKVVQVANKELPKRIEGFLAQQKDKVSNIQRGYDIPDTKDRILMTRPDDTNILKKTQNNVEKRYQELSNEREIPKPKEVPQFEDDLNSHSFQNTSDLYDKIMDMRNGDDKVVAFSDEKDKPCFVPYETGESGSDFGLLDGKVETNDHCNPFDNDSREKMTKIDKKVNMDNVVPNNIKEEHSLIDDRNKDEVFVKDQFCDNDPKDLYKDVLSKSKIDTMTPPPRTNEIEFINKPDLKNKNIVNHEVIINASDRNWYGYWDKNGNGKYRLIRSGNYNRYNFVVKFSPGDISNERDGSNSLNILRTFNNVKEIVLQTMNMAYFDNTYIYKNNEEYINSDFRSYPFVLVSIDELNNFTQTTSKKRFPYFSKLNTQTCVTVRDKNIRGYSTMIPAMQAKRDFYNNPLQQLDKMSISILKPDGNLYASENNYNLDNVLVSSLTFENSDNGTVWIDSAGKTDYIVLNLEPFINKSQYKIGDYILIRNLKCVVDLNDSNNLVYDTTKTIHKTLEEFINREEGHRIVKLGAEGDLPDFTNKIYIRADYMMDINSGTYVNSMMVKYAADGYETSGSSVNCMGELLNYSIQPTLTLDIKTIDFFIDNQQ
tara:strand:+ start:94 stop:2106 length:2013 start_codon:yes stop_codon:yes gene_type:complete